MEMSEIYTEIAQNIVDNIEENWISAELNIEAGPDWAQTNGAYINYRKENKPLAVHNFDDFLEFKIMELHTITTKGGHNQWNRGIFKLWPDGNFDMEFIWDQKLHDEIERLGKE